MMIGLHTKVTEMGLQHTCCCVPAGQQGAKEAHLQAALVQTGSKQAEVKESRVSLVVP